MACWGYCAGAIGWSPRCRFHYARGSRDVKKKLRATSCELRARRRRSPEEASSLKLQAASQQGASSEERRSRKRQSSHSEPAPAPNSLLTDYASRIIFPISISFGTRHQEPARWPRRSCVGVWGSVVGVWWSGFGVRCSLFCSSCPGPGARRTRQCRAATIVAPWGKSSAAGTLPLIPRPYAPAWGRCCDAPASEKGGCRMSGTC